MKHVTKICAIALSLVMVISLAACSGSGQLKDGLDLQTLAEDLLTGMAWQDKDLAQLPDQLWDRYIDQVDQADLAAHMVIAGGGATAEEIALFQAKDADSAARVETAMNERFEYFRTSFGNYTPEQLVNLEDPVLIRNGNYVLSVISSDNPKAKQIIEAWIDKNK